MQDDNSKSKPLYTIKMVSRPYDEWTEFQEQIDELKLEQSDYAESTELLKRVMAMGRE